MENQLPPFGYNVLRVFDSVFFIEEAFNSNTDEAQIGYGLALFTDVEESWIQYNVRVDFSTNESRVFASGTVVTKFGIDNLKQFIKDDALVWPANVLESMFGIAFSHTRALMAKNMAPTQFSKFVVPIINPAEVFKQLMQAQPAFKQVNEDEINESIKTEDKQDISYIHLPRLPEDKPKKKKSAKHP